MELKRPETVLTITIGGAHFRYYKQEQMDSFLSNLAAYAKAEMKDSKETAEYEDYETILKKTISLIKGESTVWVITKQEANHLAEQIRKAMELRKEVIGIMYWHTGGYEISKEQLIAWLQKFKEADQMLEEVIKKFKPKRG